MTNPAVSQRFIAGAAAAISAARASLGHPDWDEAGIAAALRTAAEHTPLDQLLIAFVRGAGDETNETPAALLHANNRAWDSDGHTACPQHGDGVPRRPSGECAHCWADRSQPAEPVPLHRHGHGQPPSPETRQQMLDAIHRRPARSAQPVTPGQPR